MEYTTLNNGVKMPMAGIGTFLLTPDEAEASCVSALQNGYRLIDTANAYVNEKTVGRAMKKSGLQREVYALEGRFHFYEGYTMKEVCYPFYTLKLLGVEQVILTNAAGGVNRSFAPGTLMLLTDFINMMGTNPLIGPNDERFGPRFPDMTEVFDPGLRALAGQTADELGIAYREGVYLGFMGPCYETAAEIRAFAAMGADAVGMSTVPDAMVCSYLGMKVLAVSCITNMATGIQAVKHSHARVMEIANRTGDTLCRWLGEVIRRM